MRERTELKVNQDGQFEIHVTDTWGTRVYTMSRKETREKAEKALETLKASA